MTDYSGYIQNLHFKPFLDLGFKGLDDSKNYFDVSNQIYLIWTNKLNSKINNLSYSLEGKVIEPSD